MPNNNFTNPNRNIGGILLGFGVKNDKMKKPTVQEKQQKIPIELNLVNGKVFINFWDYKGGKDVVCELKNGQILIKLYGIRKRQVISFKHFINLVKAAANGE